MVKVLRTLGDKGQITIPKEVREVLDLNEGDIVEVEVLGVARKAVPAKPGRKEVNA